MKDNVKVAKISLSINKEKSSLTSTEIYSFFRSFNKEITYSSNKLISFYWNIYQEVDSLTLEDKTKLNLINLKTGLPNTGKVLLLKYLKIKNLENDYKNTLHFFNPKGLSFITTSLSKVIKNKIINDINDISYGKKSLSNFKLGMPIPMNITGSNNYKLCSDYSFEFNKDIVFNMYFGRDRSNNKILVDRVLNGEYKLCDSSIQFKDGKFTFLLVYKFDSEIKEFNKDTIVGVDLGLVNSAVLTLNKGFEREFIDLQGKINSLRNHVQRNKWRLSKDLKHLSGGRGRNKKLKSLDRIGEKESNIVKNINHLISKKVIDFAVKNNAGVIKLECLKGFSEKQKNNKFLKNWTYNQLQLMIEYKAKEKNIEIKYVDPYHTSQTCSKCGNYETGQREVQAIFECKSSTCGHKENADLNAARNIANSEFYMNEETEGQYYQLHKNKKENACI